MGRLQDDWPQRRPKLHLQQETKQPQVCELTVRMIISERVSHQKTYASSMDGETNASFRS